MYNQTSIKDVAMWFAFIAVALAIVVQSRSMNAYRLQVHNDIVEFRSTMRDEINRMKRNQYPTIVVDASEITCNGIKVGSGKFNYEILNCTIDTTNGGKVFEIFAQGDNDEN